jgi:hypothetical protein
MLTAWTIYDHPRDYPESFVARQYDLEGGEPVPTANVMIAASLETLRDIFLERGLTCFPRNEGDDAVIVETWL